MSFPAIPDIISVVGSAYFQPIADLIDRLTAKPPSEVTAVGSGIHENGYSASICVLLVAVLESYTTRLRFKRTDVIAGGNMPIPELLKQYFPDLPNTAELVEVCLLRNLVIHNHIWHLDVSAPLDHPPSTIATPQQVGFHTNKSYLDCVDLTTRTTRKMGLNAIPTSVSRRDAEKVFREVWRTLRFMSSKSYDHTPITGLAVAYRGKRRQFDDLISELVVPPNPSLCYPPASTNEAE